MKISCPSCSAKYSIADEKVQSRLAKIRCRKCGTSIVIDGNVAPPNVYAADGGAPAATAAAAAGADPPSPSADSTYSVDLGENDQRQMSVSEIVDAYNAGSITAETFVWADGFADWTALSQIEEIVGALHQASQQDSPTAPTDETSAASASTAPQESPWDSNQASPVIPTPSAGADLFGNVETAGGEQDASTASSPSPFGGPAPAAETGARNESSVLFSLSALTSGASPSRPPSTVPLASSPSSLTSSNDDSGLIDLKALTATAEAMSSVPAASPAAAPLAAASPLGGSPLGGSPLGGSAMGASIPPMAGNGRKTGLIVGGFVALAIVAAAFILRGGDEEEPVVPPAAAAPAPIAAALPAATAAPLPTSDAKAPSTGTEDDEKEKAPKKTTTRRRSRPKSSGTKAKAKASSSSPTPKPKAKPKTRGKCGCKKDDLMCLMSCAQ